MGRICKLIVVNAHLMTLTTVLLLVFTLSAVVAYGNLYSLDTKVLHAGEDILIANSTWIVLLLILLGGYGVSVVRRVLQTLERKKLEELLQSAWRTGKVIHKGKVYIIEEYCGVDDGKLNRKCRSFIVRDEGGASRVYRLPIERASEFREERP